MTTNWTIDGVRVARRRRRFRRGTGGRFLQADGSKKSELKAYLALSPERGGGKRIELMRWWRRKAVAALGGAPVAIKDVISTRGTNDVRPRKSSKLHPAVDATAVTLEAAGAVILARRTARICNGQFE